MKCINKTTGKEIFSNVKLADTYLTRLVGLLSKSKLSDEEGLLITRCPSVHTFFMRFSIDVVFLNKDNKVVKLIGNMRPWRMSPWVREAENVLELNSQASDSKIKQGDILEFI
jgi:uncharacterized protein